MPQTPPFDLDIAEDWVEFGGYPVGLILWEYHHAVGTANIECFCDMRHIILMVAIGIYSTCFRGTAVRDGDIARKGSHQ